MSETDPGPLSTITNGSPIYAKFPALSRSVPHLSSITHIIVILYNLQH